MNVSSSDIILLSHAGFGVLGSLLAVWVFVETLNAGEDNAARIRTASLWVAISMAAAWVLGGYWYVFLYAPEKALILKGPWPFAHNLFMETKEHLFFVTLILAFYLPIAASDKLYANASARTMVMWSAALIVLTGLAIEGAGAVINHGVKVALLQAAARGMAK